MDLVRPGHVAVPALSGTGGAGGGLVRADRAVHPFRRFPGRDPGARAGAEAVLVLAAPGVRERASGRRSAGERFSSPRRACSSPGGPGTRSWRCFSLPEAFRLGAADDALSALGGRDRLLRRRTRAPIRDPPAGRPRSRCWPSPSRGPAFLLLAGTGARTGGRCTFRPGLASAIVAPTGEVDLAGV
jgi:hypothetical protein